ncbi:MAG: hypothetical protein ACON3Z_18450 [Bradymonadia bacterium]
MNLQQRYAALFVVLFATIGCESKTGASGAMTPNAMDGGAQTQTGTDMTMMGGETARTDPNPPELADGDIYEVELREGVINLDGLSEFDEVRITPAGVCDGPAPMQSDEEKQRFGDVCHQLRIVHERGTPHDFEVDNIVFSPKHQIMGRVTNVSTQIRDRLILTVRRVERDDVFNRVRVKGRLKEILGDATMLDENQSPLAVRRQALEIQGERDFSYQDSLEHNFGFGTNPATATGTLTVSGTIIVDAHFGFAVPDEEEYFNVELGVEAGVNGGFEFSSNFDNVADTESPPLTFTKPMRMGWVYAELIFESKLIASAEFEASVTANVDWSAGQTFISKSRWTDADGWSTDTEGESTPFEVTTTFEAEGDMTVGIGVELSTSFVLYKALGAKVAVAPKLEGAGKGEVSGTLSSNDLDLSGVSGCLELKSGVDLEVSGIVIGLDDIELHEERLLESVIASTGECEDEEPPVDEEMPEDQTLPIDQETPVEGFQFSRTPAGEGGRCDDFHSVLPVMQLRAIAQRCIDNPQCSFSLLTCDARFPARQKRGVCSVNDGSATFTYYRDVFECPDPDLPPMDGFAPCNLTRQQEFGDVTWTPSC